MMPEFKLDATELETPPLGGYPHVIALPLLFKATAAPEPLPVNTAITPEVKLELFDEG